MMITLDDLLMERDKIHPLEWTPERQNNALNFLEKLNGFLQEIGLGEAELNVVSGWRPWKINEQVGGAIHSGHLDGRACDLKDDPEQTLWMLCAAHPVQLRRYGLFLEHRKNTNKGGMTWVHIDDMERPDRPTRVFEA